MGWLVAAYAVALVGYLAVNLLAARLLGAAQFGPFLVVTTVAFVLGQLALFGAHRAGLREVARLDTSDRAGLAAVGREAMAVAFIAVPAVALATGAIYVAADATRLDGQRVWLGLEIGTLVIVNAFQKLGANYLRGLGRLAAASLVDGSAGGALTLSVQGSLLGLLFLSGQPASLVGVVALCVLGYVPSMVIVTVLLRPLWHGLPTSGLVRSLGDVLHRYRAFAVIQVVGFAGASLEIWLAAVTLDNVDASYFGAAQRLALLLAVPLTALQSVASPAISRMALTVGGPALERALRTSATVALVGAGPIAIPLLLEPGRALAIVLGSSRSGFAAVLVVLGLSQLVNVATGMCIPVLTMSRFEGLVARTTTVGLCLRVLLGVPAALVGGAMGLALMSCAVSAAVWVVLTRQAESRCAINTLPTLHPRIGALRAIRG